MLKISDMDKARVTLLANLAKNELADLVDLLQEKGDDEEKISDIAAMLIMLAGTIKRIDEILMPVQFESGTYTPPWRCGSKHVLN